MIPDDEGLTLSWVTYFAALGPAAYIQRAVCQERQKARGRVDLTLGSNPFGEAGNSEHSLQLKSCLEETGVGAELELLQQRPKDVHPFVPHRCSMTVCRR